MKNIFLLLVLLQINILNAQKKIGATYCISNGGESNKH